MRIQLISDLHLERYPDYLPQAAPGVDVLVLAGDIGSYQHGAALGGDDFGLDRFSPLRAGAPWSRVLFVPGNHEFDGLDFADTYARLQATCARLGIDWLEQAVVRIGDVRFVGTTLWSDFTALARRCATPLEQQQALDKAFRAANFYLRKHTTLRAGQPLLAQDLQVLARSCQRWLRDTLTMPFPGRTVVVTHFAPTLRSADPRYGLAPGTAGFCNALDDLLPWAQLWMHGHLHCANDFMVQGQCDGRDYACRVVANPRGYLDKGEHASYQEQWVVDLD